MSMQIQEILKYINLGRQYPKYYIGLIEEQLASFVDQINIELEKDVYYETIEGKSAWEEARTFLINQEPLRPFDFHEGLAKAATDHTNDIVKNQLNRHQGSDGSTFVERIQRYCRKGKGNMIQLVGTTHTIPQKNSIEMAIINLIIDDGVTNRGHRRALFNKDYKYIGADFAQSQGKIFSVITLTQANLQIIKNQPQSIATSTSHLKTLTQISSQVKQNRSVNPKSKQNFIDVTSSKSPVKEFKSGQSIETPQKPTSDVIWTLKNVNNEGKIQSLKKTTEPKNIQQIYPQPSIFQQVNQSVYSNHSNQKSQKSVQGFKLKQEVKSSKGQSKSSIASSATINPQIPVRQGSTLTKNGGSQAQLKQSTLSLKNSQQSLKMDNKSKAGTSQGFGTSSQVEKFKIKSTLASPFLKTNTFSSSFGSTQGRKKVVQKKQTMKSWCQDQFMIKEVTTIIKYDDGTIQDFVEKHSLLKNSESLLKEQVA